MRWKPYKNKETTDNFLLERTNVRTLADKPFGPAPKRRTALVSRELERYLIDIAALSETRPVDASQLQEVGCGYTFFWKGKRVDEKAGVSFDIRSKLVPSLVELPKGVNDRLMTLRLQLHHCSYYKKSTEFDARERGVTRISFSVTSTP